MENSPAYQNYPGDFFTDPEVMFWSMEMYGCYCKLINYLWLSGGYLPLNYERMAQLFCTKRRDRAELLFSKIKVKFQIIDEVISHKRVLEEIQKQENNRLMKSNAGKAGAKARWQTHDSAINKTIAKNSSSSSSSSSTSLNKKKGFVKPTVSEIKEYIQEKNLTADADAIFDHYESNGWRVGRNPMKDWRRTVNGWARRDFTGKPKAKPQKKFKCCVPDCDNEASTVISGQGFCSDHPASEWRHKI